MCIQLIPWSFDWYGLIFYSGYILLAEKSKAKKFQVAAQIRPISINDCFVADFKDICTRYQMTEKKFTDHIQSSKLTNKNVPIWCNVNFGPAVIL